MIDWHSQRGFKPYRRAHETPSIEWDESTATETSTILGWSSGYSRSRSCNYPLPNASAHYHQREKNSGILHSIPKDPMSTYATEMSGLYARNLHSYEKKRKEKFLIKKTTVLFQNLTHASDDLATVFWAVMMLGTWTLRECASS